jgi:hypothetical protein
VLGPCLRRQGRSHPDLLAQGVDVDPGEVVEALDVYPPASTIFEQFMSRAWDTPALQ